MVVVGMVLMGQGYTAHGWVVGTSFSVGCWHWKWQGQEAVFTQVLKGQGQES